MLYVIAAVSFIFGFLACAILTSGKIADLDAEIVYQKKLNKSLDRKLEEILEGRA